VRHGADGVLGRGDAARERGDARDAREGSELRDARDALRDVTVVEFMSAHLDEARGAHVRRRGDSAARAHEHQWIPERVFAAALARQGLWDDATSHFEQVRALTRHVGYPYAEGLVQYEWGRVLLERSDRREEALQRVEEACAIFQRLGAKPLLARAQALLLSSEASVA